MVYVVGVLVDESPPHHSLGSTALQACSVNATFEFISPVCYEHC